MYDLPGYVWALVLLGVIGIPVSTCAVLYRGAIRARLGWGRAATVAGGAAVVLGGWLALNALLAGSGVYRQQPAELVAIVAVPLAVALHVVSLRLLAAAVRAERRAGTVQPLPVSG